MRAISGLAILLLMLLSRTAPVRAQEPSCSDQDPCLTGSAREWHAGKRSAFVTRQSGGTLHDPTTRVYFDFPPASVPRDLTVTYESGIAPAAPLPEGRRALGFFRLSATDAQGTEHTQFEAPWTVSIEYSECEQEPGLCALALIDEASLHCAALDVGLGTWQRTAGQVDVFTNRLICTAASASDYAVLALPAATSGETDYHHLFLPLVAQ